MIRRETYGNNIGIWKINRISWQLGKVVRKAVGFSGCIQTAGRTAVRTNFCSWSELETWTGSWSYQYEPTLSDRIRPAVSPKMSGTISMNHTMEIRMELFDHGRGRTNMNPP